MKILVALYALAAAAFLSGCEPKTTPAPKVNGPAGTEQPAPGSAVPNGGMPGPGNPSSSGQTNRP